MVAAQKYYQRFLALLLVAGVLGCQAGLSPGPESRLQTYLGMSGKLEQAQSVASFPDATGRVEAGFMLVNDAVAPGAAPVLSPETFAHMSGLLRNRIMRELPITIVKDLPTDGLSLEQGFSQITKRAQEAEVRFVMLALLSSRETKYPTHLPFNGVLQQAPRGSWDNPGYETQNFSLVELALLDVETERVMVMADGQAWATLYTLDNRLKSNVYPVVVRAQQVSPIYPESYDNAPDILRAVSADDAMKQALMHLKESWPQPRPASG